jgi:hypothetical protein
MKKSLILVASLILLVILVIFFGNQSSVNKSPELEQYENINRTEQLHLGEIFQDFSEPIISEILVKSVKYGGAFPKIGCIQLYQSDFDKYTSDVTFGDSGECVELMENVDFNYSIILKGNGFYLDCNNNKLTGIYSHEEGYAGIIGTENSIIKNCIVEKKFYNFLLTDFAEVYDSLATGFFTHDGTWYSTIGFELRDSSKAYNSAASNNGGGFALEAFAEVYNGSAINNSAGYWLFTDSGIYDSLAKENRFGYILRHNASIDNSLAENNIYTGFDFTILGVSIVSNSIARGNSVGFIVGEENIIYSSLAEDNVVGFSVFGDAKVYDSLSSGNSLYGFALDENSFVENVAVVDNEYGIIVSGSSVLKNSVAENNTWFGLMGHDSLSTIQGGKFCFNGYTGDVWITDPTLSGVIRVGEIDGEWSGDPTFLPCKKVLLPTEPDIALIHR